MIWFPLFSRQIQAVCVSCAKLKPSAIFVFCCFTSGLSRHKFCSLIKTTNVTTLCYWLRRNVLATCMFPQLPMSQTTSNGTFPLHQIKRHNARSVFCVCETTLTSRIQRGKSWNVFALVFRPSVALSLDGIVELCTCCRCCWGDPLGDVPARRGVPVRREGGGSPEGGITLSLG